jgi:hypothetical protein
MHNSLKAAWFYSSIASAGRLLSMSSNAPTAPSLTASGNPRPSFDCRLIPHASAMWEHEASCDIVKASLAWLSSPLVSKAELLEPRAASLGRGVGRPLQGEETPSLLLKFPCLRRVPNGRLENLAVRSARYNV